METDSKFNIGLIRILQDRGVIETLLYLYRNPVPLLKNHLQTELGLSPPTGIKVHLKLIDLGLINQISNRSRYNIYGLTSKGRNIAAFLSAIESNLEISSQTLQELPFQNTMEIVHNISMNDGNDQKPQFIQELFDWLIRIIEAWGNDIHNYNSNCHIDIMKIESYAGYWKYLGIREITERMSYRILEKYTLSIAFMDVSLWQEDGKSRVSFELDKRQHIYQEIIEFAQNTWGISLKYTYPKEMVERLRKISDEMVNLAISKSDKYRHDILTDLAILRDKIIRNEDS